jgi:NADH:ubiquinone oxidoreductase subunit 4 (subunit M)
LIVFLSLALLVSYLNTLGITKFAIAIAMCICSIFIFKWLDQQSGFLRKLMNIFATLGLLSMPISLAHPIFSSFAREVLVLLGITSISIQFVIGTILGVVCSLLMYHLSVKLKLNVLFGFDVPKNKIGVYFRSRIPL